MITTSIVKQTTLFFLSIDKLNLRLVCVSQYLSQFSLNVRHRIERLHTISNALFKLLAFEDKHNKNKLLILDKINNFATNVEAIIELMRQTFKEKSNLVDQNTINKTILFHLCLVQISEIFKKRLLETYVKFIK